MTEQIITIPADMELVKVNETEYKIVKKKNKLPQSWYEFCKTYSISTEEQYITAISRIEAVSSCGDERDEITDKNVLPNKEYAEAILALCQLIQLRDCYRQGWEPNWSETNSKHSIKFRRYEIVKDGSFDYHHPFTFQSEEIRDEFLNNFKDLIKKTKPLFT